MYATQPEFNDLRFYNDLLPLRTEEAMQFIDLTAWVGETVRRSGVGHGYVQIQVLHTTALPTPPVRGSRRPDRYECTYWVRPSSEIIRPQGQTKEPQCEFSPETGSRLSHCRQFRGREGPKIGWRDCQTI